MRTATASLLFLLCVLRVHSQGASDKHSLFGCSENAVEVAVDNTPPLRITPVKGLPLPSGNERPAFRFPALGPFLVNIYLFATLPEAGRGTKATLHIYAETTDSANDPQTKRVQWWEVVPTERVDPFNGRSSTSLSFDTSRIASCFEQEGQCSFAEVALATPDPNVPLLVIKFGENLGGANALNWTEASIMLDFRSTQPRVVATADCAYNEGGGACTAFDSGQMLRSGLQCDWGSETQDFLCSQTTQSDGYLDFFLLSDKPAPLHPGEVATLADAIQEFRSKGTATPVKVRGIGPVSWIDEVTLDSGNKIIVLGSVGLFHLVAESKTSLGPSTQVAAHPLIVDPNEVRRPSRIEDPGWTLEEARSFRARQIYKEKNLTVLQVVESQLPDSRNLYWLGMQGDGADAKFDAVVLVGGGHYASCGNSIVPENVVSVERIAKPFSAQVRIQPPTSFSEADESQQHEWVVPNGEEQSANCIRSGSITWANGKFTGNMDDKECTFLEQPKDIRVEADGNINAKDVVAKPVK